VDVANIVSSRLDGTTGPNAPIPKIECLAASQLNIGPSRNGGVESKRPSTDSKEKAKMLQHGKARHQRQCEDVSGLLANEID
jgi:hypothetical protein